MIAKKETKRMDKLVPDTSVIIEGLLSMKIEKSELLPEQVIIHEAVLAELEHQANQNKSIGYLGLDEIDRLRKMSQPFGFSVVFGGKRPGAYEIAQAKMGEIDTLIRELAFENDATLLTTDKVQARIGLAKGIDVILLEVERIKKKLKLESFFDETTMSVHLRENVFPYAKKGRPGKWDFVKVRESVLTRDEVRDIGNEIIEESGIRKECFIEIERAGSTIVQFENYRTVITRPPFSDGWEITSVRPVKKLSLEEYNLPEKVKDRIAKQAEGMLIAGAPGQGKSTFAQALAEHYAAQDKIVKTVEAPRDLQLPDTITQYAISHGSPQEIHDILLLSRPDYTIFDEMRNTDDFRLFADMRLSGVGMVGVLHATNAIDAIQRFIGRIELGTIPQIVDTVLFIRNGGISKVFSIRMEVKVPSGMTEADLARPVVVVYDFQTNKLEFEIYSYGEETVVVPVRGEAAVPPARALAKKEVEREFQRYSEDVEVDFPSDYGCVVKVPESAIAAIIGKQGSNIEKIEKKLGIHIDVQPWTGSSGSGEGRKRLPKGDTVPYEINLKKNNIELYVDSRFVERDLQVYLGDEFLVELHVGKKGMVRIRKDNSVGKAILGASHSKEKLKIFAG